MFGPVLLRRWSRYFAAAALAVTALASAPPAHAVARRPVTPDWGLFGPAPDLSELSWLETGIHQSRPFRLAPDRSLSLLAHYLAPAQNHVAEWRSFYRGDYGFSSWSPRFSLSWALATETPARSAQRLDACLPKVARAAPGEACALRRR
jgi:hypothetical protein